MSAKWISGFPPLRPGSYLTCYILSGFHPTESKGYKNRLDYNANNGYWYKGGMPYQKDSLLRETSKLTFWWWDEYGNASEKIVRKLKF